MIARSALVSVMSIGLFGAALPVSAAPAPAAAPTAAAAAADAGESAEDPKITRAKELLENGANLYNEGSYEAAILAFQEGYDLTEEPAFLYNIGNCYERLGRFDEARRYLDQYRAFAPESEREILARRITALDERIRKQREEEAAAKAASSATPEPKEPKEPEPTPPPAEDSSKPPPIFGPTAIALSAVAAGGLGVGIGFGIKANGERRAALDHCVSQGESYLCGTASQDPLDRRRTSALVADIGFAVAGAAAIAVITVVALKASQRKKAAAATDNLSRRPRVAPYASPAASGGGFVLHGRF